MKEKRQRIHSSGSSLNRMELMNLVVTAGSLGLTLFVCIFVGVLIGRVMDEFLATSPWGIILFSLLGTVSGFWSLYKRTMACMNRQLSAQKKDVGDKQWKN